MATRTRFTNNGIDTLDGNINSSVTSLNVVAASLFPSEGNFYIQLSAETMLVTAVSAATFTVVRAQLGTTAVAHSTGDFVKAIATNDLLEGYARESHVFDSQDTPKFTITSPATGLLVAVTDLTWVNQGSATAVDRDGKILLTVPADAGDQFRGLFISAPTAPYEIVMAWSHLGACGGTAAVSPFPQSELVFRESSTGKMSSIVCMPRDGTLVRPTRLQVKHMTDNTTFSSSVFLQEWQFGQGPIWCKIADDNANLIFSVGPNGQDWIQVASVSRTVHMAGAPNQIGFGCNPSADSTNSIMQEVLHLGAV
jgi:hypothetical protein